MGIIRINNNDEEIILLVCAYLEHVPLRTERQKKQNPFDNIYKYLYHHGHLWIDLITVNRMNGPLIGIYDCDCMYPIVHTIDGSLQSRYHILRPFCQDSREMGEQGLKSYNTLVTNLLNNISLPSRTELALFKCLANPITNDEIEVDIDEH